MKDKRTLSSALGITPDTLAYIRKGERLVEPAPEPVKLHEPIVESPTEPAEPTEEIPSPPKQVRRVRPASAPPRGNPATLRYRLKMPITTKLLPETFDRLYEAYMERRLARTAQATIQDIVEEAVQSWLAKHID